MQFNGNATNQDIVSDIYFEATADSVSYPIEDVTRHVNFALDEVLSLVLESSGTWQFDDLNNTDLPIGTTALVASQADYSFADDFLKVEDVWVLDESSNWHVLKQVDRNDPQLKQEIINLSTTTGTPKYFDVFGETIKLYAPSSYSQAASLKVFFQRGMSYFDTTDTTKKPGFASHLHKFVILYSAFTYAEAKGLAKKTDLFTRLDRERQRIVEHYSKRNLSKARRITPNIENCR